MAGKRAKEAKRARERRPQEKRPAARGKARARGVKADDKAARKQVTREGRPLVSKAPVAQGGEEPMPAPVLPKPLSSFTI